MSSSSPLLRARLLLGACVLASALIAGLAPAQEPTPAPTPQAQVVDAAAIDAQKKVVGSDQALTTEQRDQALSILEEARTNLTQQAQWAERRSTLATKIDGAEAELARVRDLLAQPQPEPDSSTRLFTPLTELEGELTAERDQQRVESEKLQRIEQEIQQLPQRRVDTPKALADARTERTEVQQLLAAAPAANEPASLQQARRLRQRARLQRIDAQIAALELELSSFDTIAQLLQAHREEQRRRVAVIGAKVGRLESIAADKRRQEIDRDERAARQALARSGAETRALAQENVDLVTSLRDLLVEREKATRLRSQVQERRTSLDSEFSDARQRVDLVGLTEAIGLELRQLRRTELQNIENIRRSTRSLHAQQTAAFERRFRYEDDRQELQDLDAAVEMQLAAIGPADARRDAVATEVRNLLTARRGFLDALIDGYGQLTTEYSQVDTEVAQLMAEAEECTTFIDERVLWIPSTRPIWQGVSGQQLADAREFLRACEPGYRALGAAITSRPLGIGAAVALIAALLLLRPWLRRRLEKHGAAARSRTTTSFAPTARALVDTLLLALPPALVLCAAALLATGASEAAALRVGLFDAALVALALSVVRGVCRTGGLGESHFDWDAGLLGSIRRDLRWLAPLLVLAAFVLGSLANFGVHERLGSVGRLAVIVPALGLGVFMGRLLHPVRGALVRHARGEVSRRRTRLLVYLLGIGVPFALLVLSLLGYTFTAIELYTRFELTLVLTAVVVLTTYLVFRWLLLSRRTLAIQQARERRRVLKEEGSEASAELEQQAVDLAAVDQQTRRLVRVAAAFVLVIGTWAIWVDVLPALGILREVELWNEVVQVTETDLLPDGTQQARTVEQLRPITLASLLFALLLLLGTSVVARNLGGLLEVALLRHMKVQAGERYAITTLTRYTIVAVGVLVAFGSIGLGWSKVQWLLAAISVGLGFGLQEIFANFVSGLILLFERPVRVGDLVTVGDLDGRVTRIQMRATTITDWDRKELVVPNREFITSRFVNWSLSNPITRIVVKVGVAYGTDTAKAQELLLECARKCKTVLRDPEPNTVFRGFGESSLDLELRVYIASMDEWVDAMNEVHRAVDETFKANGIEIAFPQRDLHLRTVKGLHGAFPSLEPRPEPEFADRS